MKSLNIVLKTVERCNLNCSYCYFFNGLDRSYKGRPKFISRSTIQHIVSFVKSGIKDLDVGYLSVGLHGGEPLMQPKEDFINLIETFRDIGIEVDFTVQTNATLVTRKWIELLNRYDIGVGVSIDGPLFYHDKYRLDHKGNGSHTRVVRGIRLLQEGLLKQPSCLTVINPEFSGGVIYRYLIDLGFKKLDFLLPDNNNDILPDYPIKSYAEYLIEVFDNWVKDDDIEISIRKFKSIILQLLGYQPLIYGFGRTDNSDSTTTG